VFHFREGDEGIRLARSRASLRPQAVLPTQRKRPMLPRLIDDPKRWLECAAEMRLVAFEIADSDGRVIALRVAKDLEWFADWVDLRKDAQPANTPL
jgi:hypothetical protein